MVKRFLISSLLIITIFQLLSAQNQQIIDSLDKLSGNASDIEKARLFNQLAWEYRNSDIPMCIQFARKASVLAEKTNDLKEYSVAISYIGVAYRNIGDFPKALEFYFEALKISEKAHDKEQVAYSLNNIGNIYIYQENFQEALRYIERALNLAEELDIPKLRAYCYLNLGRIHKNFNNFDSSLFYLSKTQEIRQELGDLQSIGSAKYDIAEAYLVMGNKAMALKFFFESIEILQKVGDKDGQSFCYNNIAKIYMQQGQFDDALEYAQKGLVLANEVGLRYEQKKSNYILSEIFAARNDFPQAFEYLKDYITVNDSIFNQESTNKLAQYQIKSELEKQEAQIQLLIKDKKLEAEKVKRTRFVTYVLLSAMLIILVVLYYIYKNYLEKRRINKILEDQKEEIEAQRDTIEEEKSKSEQLLLNILPKDTAWELKEHGFAPTKIYENVSVLFADLIEFSIKSEVIDPNLLIDELNHCFIVFDNITDKYNIEKIKTIGDAYMCVGGIPKLQKNSHINTVKAAIEMQQFMLQWKEEKLKLNQPFWEMRIGIHTGSVIGGVIGKKKFAFDIWGNTVNIASRMETSGEANKINISETTYQIVKDHFTCQYRGKVAAKNVGEIDMYFVEF